MRSPRSPAAWCKSRAPYRAAQKRKKSSSAGSPCSSTIADPRATRRLERVLDELRVQRGRTFCPEQRSEPRLRQARARRFREYEDRTPFTGERHSARRACPGLRREQYASRSRHMSITVRTTPCFSQRRPGRAHPLRDAQRRPCVSAMR